MTDTPVLRLVDYALWYASRGWHVFPLHGISGGRCTCGHGDCESPGKHPRISKKAGGRGALNATTDRATIEAWWAKWPNANVGLATGPSGLVVLDVDGPEGGKQLLEVSGGVIPPTLTVRTGREGGYHLYYSGLGIPQSQRKGEHLDVRGSSGYVVAPPSLHITGRRWEWVDQLAAIVAVPAWVKPWVAARGRKDTPPNVDLEVRGERPVARSRRLADRALDGLSGGEPFSFDEARRLASALASIPADVDGKTWFSYLGALHALEWIVGDVDVGFEIADKWSGTSKGQGAGNGEYRGRSDVWKRWQGFNKEFNGVKCTVGSIYADAKARGWRYQVETAKPENVNGHNGVYALPAALRADSNAIRFPDTDKFGKPKATCANARAALRMLGVSCGYDEFHDKMHVAGHPVGQWVGDLTDNAVHMLRVVIQQQYRFDPGTVGVYDATVQECLQHAYDPVQDYLDALVWDRRPRLGVWMRDYLGADDSQLTSEIARLSLLAAVRRAREPGTKFDQIIVLEGPEGQGKSSAIELLAGPENYSDQRILSLDDRGQQEAVRGVWLYEIADLAGHSKTEIESEKVFVSRTTDRARPAYGRARVDRPRRCIFFGSTNSDTYLKSQTGNRRFWPVRTARIDLEALARDRDQIWAEAVFVEETRCSLFLPPALWGAAAALQDARRDEDPWDDDLRGIEERHLKGRTVLAPDTTGMEYRIATRDILDLVLRLPVERRTDVTAKRVAYSLRRLGWQGPKVLRGEHGSYRGWTKSAKWTV